MKTYVGYRGAKGPVVLVDNGEPWIGLRPLRMREDLRDHSPVGPNWGPGCSGSAQLALALLADATGDDEAAWTCTRSSAEQHSVHSKRLLADDRTGHTGPTC